ncbi:hypothetical protein [Ectropis obliqua nucleopolyhedrovirus]|uniref:Putative 18.5 kDa protein n=1 Tax=Ectropis obliqua nucleopolyhedrovirus TaxID=59376 RepID=A0EYT1_9ABAC|nr:hypothetical protein EONV_gp028 [Ectropis obliqua nucleopolyhedrovirus]ABI35712.1 hypothetical protein [Ectropis obliqua nucleopolyhedrovirus]AGS47889.1 putative 18.5 kDa protein [Ectropis obliqua nucleopolyhedrovirus]QWV59614.1 hypothetical protein EONV_gp028 [Ectropis obliqua nucleopolyhedrovirus]UYO72820.1 hypothetical protein EONV-gp028 [Ectropis obliqua nucleopolyhedrovirus]
MKYQQLLILAHHTGLHYQSKFKLQAQWQTAEQIDQFCHTHLLPALRYNFKVNMDDNKTYKSFVKGLTCLHFTNPYVQGVQSALNYVFARDSKRKTLFCEFLQDNYSDESKMDEYMKNNCINVDLSEMKIAYKVLVYDYGDLMDKINDLQN